MTQEPYVTRPGETEADFQTWVLDLAQVTGWLCHAERPAQTSKGWRTPIQGDKGFPDLVLVKGQRIIFAELKSEKGIMSREQQVWFAYLKDTVDDRLGISVVVWRPSDRPEIERVLKGEV